MGRNARIVAYGLGGVVLALGMSLGAFALAGSTLSEPPPTVRIVGTTQTPRPTVTPSTASASPDDHGDASADPTPTASPDDHGSDDDNSGPGSSGDDGHDDD